ncbi:MAG: hypothetical protein KY462_09955 [Actinobacteria bacterium]|nr:hypothetical protein [Actinomycetota bacterium]
MDGSVRSFRPFVPATAGETAAAVMVLHDAGGTPVVSIPDGSTSWGSLTVR